LKLWALVLLTLIGCNVANEPAMLSAGSGVGGSASEKVGFSFGYFTLSEATPMFTLPITYSAPTSADSTLSFSFSGSAVGGVACTGAEDYITPSSSLLVSAGVASTVLDVTLCDDSIFEGNETLVVTITGSSAGHSLSTFGSMTILMVDSYGQAPIIEFAAAASPAVSEGASGITSVPVSIELTHASTQSITVNISATGTATGVDDLGTNQLDYYLSATQVTFPAGVTTASILVYIVGDNFIEANENITLSLYNASNASIGAQNTHNLTITQDESSSNLLAALSSAPTLLETDGAVTIPVTITGVLDVAATLRYVVDYSVAIPLRRAEFGVDYRLTGFTGQVGEVTIPAGSSSVNIGLTVINDSFYEAAENFVVRILGGGMVDVDPGFETLVLTIDPHAADLPPLVSFQTTGARLAEGNTAGNIVIRLLDPSNTALEKASGEDIEVNLLLTNDTTTAGDYIFVDTTVRIPAGTSRISVPITTIQDGVTEGSEYLDIEIDSVTPAGYTVSPNTSFRLEITDN